MARLFLVFPASGISRLRSLLVVTLALSVVATASAQAATSAAIVVDAKSGKVLYSSNADTRAYPASLTKIMTLYMLFEALDSGRTTLTSRIRISRHAAAQPPSKLGLKPGSTISVEEAILSLVTRSANDMAAAIGEHLAGTESGFARQMTTRARQLGMQHTTFRNASGLPNSSQVTTARDMAILGRAIQDRFPRYFDYFKRTSFTYRGTKIGNHNRLLGKVRGVDGIKTGYTRASGFNLVSSVNIDNRSVVAVVLGGSSGASRDARMADLLKKYVRKATAGQRTAALILPRGVSVAAYDIPTPRTRPNLALRVINPGTPSALAATAFEVAFAEENGQGDIGQTDSVKLAPPPKVSGWRIQIAAAPTEDGARAILDRAQAKAPDILSKASAYTEPVMKNSTTLHRARFAGFASRESARVACAQLKKHDFACYAVAE